MSKTTEQPDLITLDEAAVILSTSKATIRRLVQKKQLIAYKKVGIKSLFVEREKVVLLKTPQPVELGKKPIKK